MKKKPLAITLTTALLASELAAQNRAATKAELARLEPVQLAESIRGAMCYARVIVPVRLEYVCPVCGERSFRAERMTSITADELAACRRLLASLPQREALTLDEAALCVHCQPKETKRELVLVVRYTDGTSERASGVRAADLELLAEVLGGAKSAAADAVKQSALAKLTRLAALRGGPALPTSEPKATQP